MALTNLAKLQAYIGGDLLESTSAQRAIDAASAEIERFCGRTFASTDYTEWQYINPSVMLLQLNQYPVTTLTSVGTAVYNGGTVTPLTEMYDYSLYDADAGLVQFAGSVGGWVKIVYTAGYSTIPADLEQIALELAASIYRGGQRDATVQSEKIGDYSYTASGVSAVDALAPKLARWRKVRI